MEYRSPFSRAVQRPMRTVAVLRMILFWLKTYFRTQNESDERQAQVVESSVDDRIPPRDQAIYPYLFACVYILFVGWFALDKLSRREYQRAHRAYRSMIRTARQIFLERPTRMNHRERCDHPLARVTRQIDGPTNCYPSLHVALMMLSYQIIKDSPDADAVLLTGMRRACIDICRATMETKQHSVADVVGGVELARRTFAERFDGDFEDLLDEVLLELDEDELGTVRRICSPEPDLLELLDNLLAAFASWPAARTRG